MQSTYYKSKGLTEDKVLVKKSLQKTNCINKKSRFSQNKLVKLLFQYFDKLYLLSMIY